MSNRSDVPKTSKVPGTIDEFRGLMTAQGWERAAWVYAWTLPEESGGRPSKRGENSPLYNIKQFAALGITGLTNPVTVRHYRKTWVWAIEQNKASVVGPGDEFDLTLLFEEQFPPNPRWQVEADEFELIAAAEEVGLSPSSVKRTMEKKQAISAAIKADPEVERIARRALVDKEIERDRKKAADNARNRKIVDDFAPGLTAREVDETDDQFDGLVIKLRAMKRQGQDVLSGTLNLGGFRQKAKRSLIVEMVDEVRNILDAIAEAAEGRSMDDELASLLDGA